MRVSMRWILVCLMFVFLLSICVFAYTEYDTSDAGFSDEERHFLLISLPTKENSIVYNNLGVDGESTSQVTLGNCHGVRSTCVASCEDSKLACQSGNSVSPCVSECEADCSVPDFFSDCTQDCLARPNIDSLSDPDFESCFESCVSADSCFTGCVNGCDPDLLSGEDGYDGGGCELSYNYCVDVCDQVQANCGSVASSSSKVGLYTKKIETCLDQGDWAVWFYSGRITDTYYTTQGEIQADRPFCEEGSSNCRSNQMDIIYDWDFSKESCGCSETFNWLDDNVVNANPRNTNYCCGNDPWIDTGYFQMKGDDLKLCVQDPSNEFSWIGIRDNPNYNSIVGNIYSVFEGGFYEESFETIGGAISRQGVAPPRDVKYDIISDGNKWIACTTESDIIGGSLLDASARGDLYEIVTPDNDKFVSVDKGDGHVHQYVCSEDSGNARFVECSGTETPFNEYSETGEGLFWASLRSANLGESSNPLFSFEEGLVPTYVETAFKVVDSTPIDVDISSSKKMEGISSMKVTYTKNAGFSGATGIIKSEKLFRKNWENSVFSGYVYYDEFVPINLVLYDFENELYEVSLEDLFTSDIKYGDWNYFELDVDFPRVTYIEFDFIADTFNLNKEGRYEVYFDDFNLNPAGDHYFCGVDTYKSNDLELPKFQWFEARDENLLSCEGNGVFNYGSDKCCGDDDYETFFSDSGVCYNSNFVNLGERFEIIEYDLILNGDYSKPMSQKKICSDANNKCTFFLPEIKSQQTTNVTIVSKYPEKYDIVFKSTKDNSTTSSTDLIEVEVKTFELLSLDEEVRYCGKDKSLLPADLKNSVVDNFQEGDSEGCSLENNFLCTLDLGWTTTANAERRDVENATGISEYNQGPLPDLSEFDTMKSVPREFTQEFVTPKSCCPEDYCWNGIQCIEDVSNEPMEDFDFLLDNSNEGYRCIAGEWKVSERLFAPHGFEDGYCPDDSQCFVSENGFFQDNGNSLGNPQCMNDGQSLGPYYCEDGNWVSRTKFVAETLLDKTASKKHISISCDVYDNVVNDADSLIEGVSIRDVIYDIESCGSNASGFEAQNCMNNFCILETEKGVAFGTSLNIGLDDETLSIKDIFGIESVRNCIDEGELSPCFSEVVDGRQVNWYYDSSTGVLINSEYSLKLGTRYSWVDSLFNGLKRWLGQDTSNSFYQLDYSEIETNLNLNYLETDQKYDKIYYMKSNSETISAIYGTIRDIERGASAPYVGIKYESFGFGAKERDICGYVEHYNEFNPPDFELVCSKTTERGKPYYVFAVGVNQDDRLKIWNDLTSKLRING